MPPGPRGIQSPLLSEVAVTQRPKRDRTSPKNGSPPAPDGVVIQFFGGDELPTNEPTAPPHAQGVTIWRDVRTRIPVETYEPRPPPMKRIPVNQERRERYDGRRFQLRTGEHRRAEREQDYVQDDEHGQHLHVLLLIKTIAGTDPDV